MRSDPTLPDWIAQIKSNFPRPTIWLVCCGPTLPDWQSGLITSVWVSSCLFKSALKLILDLQNNVSNFLEPLLAAVLQLILSVVNTDLVPLFTEVKGFKRSRLGSGWGWELGHPVSQSESNPLCIQESQLTPRLPVGRWWSKRNSGTGGRR